LFCPLLFFLFLFFLFFPFLAFAFISPFTLGSSSLLYNSKCFISYSSFASCILQHARPRWFRFCFGNVTLKEKRKRTETNLKTFKEPVWGNK
jgi:hypothetical protein